MITQVPLSKVVQINMGTAPPGNTYNERAEGMPLIAGAGDYGETFPQPKKWTTSPINIAKKGDLIICVRATIGDLNWADTDYCLGRGVAGIRSDPEKLDIAYLAHYINSRKQDLIRLGKGSTFPAIRRADLEEFSIPLVSLPKQRRIAAILDKADEIRRKRQRAIERMEDFLRSVFLDMFGDPASNPNGWILEKMGSAITEIRCGPFGSALHKSDYVRSGIPVWGIDNVQPNHFIEHESLFITADKFKELIPYNVNDGDVLISRAGTVGRMCVAYPQQSPSIIGTNLIRVSLDKHKMAPEYMTTLFTFFSNRVGALKANAKEDAYSFLKTGVLKELVVPIPDIDTQRQYVALAEKVKACIENYRNSAMVGRKLFDSLAHIAFRGELTSNAASEIFQQTAIG